MYRCQNSAVSGNIRRWKKENLQVSSLRPNHQKALKILSKRRTNQKIFKTQVSFTHIFQFFVKSKYLFNLYFQQQVSLLLLLRKVCLHLATPPLMSLSLKKLLILLAMVAFYTFISKRLKFIFKIFLQHPLLLYPSKRKIMT